MLMTKIQKEKEERNIKIKKEYKSRLAETKSKKMLKALIAEEMGLSYSTVHNATK